MYRFIRRTAFYALAVALAGVSGAVPAQRGGACRVTLQARNEGTRPVVIRLGASRWRHRGGFWNRLSSESNWSIVADGREKTRVVDLSLPCNAGDRQYELEMSANDTERVVRVPGGDDYSGAITLALGNVARHF